MHVAAAVDVGVEDDAVFVVVVDFVAVVDDIFVDAYVQSKLHLI